MDATPSTDAFDPEALAAAEEFAPLPTNSGREEEEAHARRLAERYRLEFLDMGLFRIDQELFRAIPADLMLRYGFVPFQPRRPGAGHRRVRPDRPADDRRAGGAARHAGAGHGRRPLGDRGDPQEERELAARARRGHRGLPDPGPQGRGLERGPHRRAADQRQQPDHPAGRLDGLQRHPAPGQRHPHRDPGRRGDGQVPHRRRAAAGQPADRQALAQRDHLAHQGDGRARHRREARAAGRPLPAARARQDHRLPRLDHADRARRGRRHPHPRQGVDQRAVHRAAPRHPRLPGPRAEALPQVHPRALRHGAGHRADRIGQDHDALRRAVRDQVDRGQDHHHRGPGRVPAQGHHPDPGQREEGADLRPRPALDPAPRPRQDHGRRDPRPGDGADRHPVGAHRPPRLHHRPRQQRLRRARPLPEHGGRALQLRLGAQLRDGPAAGAQDLREVPAAGDAVARAADRVGAGPGAGRPPTRSTRARAASSAAAPASRAGWPSASCST